MCITKKNHEKSLNKLTLKEIKEINTKKIKKLHINTIEFALLSFLE